MVLDNEVISAPEIQGVLTGDSQITGSSPRRRAKELANQLKYGALPLTFEPRRPRRPSPPRWAAQYLRAGLLAAGIGMLLVAIYAFFYYRLLGTVIFLSLVLSGLLIFGALVVLGRQIGFTLTLAGIAGFIVSLGVAADSFVIYFERLKDEIREGRTPRSAVPRAWARARRTIISANAITIMAAVVLYIVSVGAVKGFAFALGLATVLDLVVVFLFRHPIMTMFAEHQGVPVAAGQRPRPRARARAPTTTSRVKPHAAREGGLTWPSSGLADRLYRGEAGPQHRRPAQDWFIVAGDPRAGRASSASCSAASTSASSSTAATSSSCRPASARQTDAQNAVQRGASTRRRPRTPQVGAAQQVGSGSDATYSSPYLDR